jgi:uncharacterized protein
MNPQIAALHELQQRDRQLTILEHRLELIPARLTELDDDLAKLEAMLNAERRKSEETRSFQLGQEQQLAEEEEMLRHSRAKLNQVKNPRELNATQREIESTRRMAATRQEEIKKLEQGVAEADQRIAAMTDSLQSLRAQAEVEKERLTTSKAKLEKKIEKLRQGRGELTEKLQIDLLRTYDRIRKRVGGIAFVRAVKGRCSACKMVIPHQIYVHLRKGDEIPACESCGRLLYWSGHFPEESEKKKEAAPKASPAQRR